VIKIGRGRPPSSTPREHACGWESPPPPERFKFNSRPNIILISGDDFEYGVWPIRSEDTRSEMRGYADGPGYVNNSAIYKDLFPTIRRWMIEDGLYLHRHVAASVCSPSRKQLLSGRSVWSQGNGDWLPIRPRYSLISDKMRQAGYTNHFVGKWYKQSHELLGVETRRAAANENITGISPRLPQTYSLGFASSAGRSDPRPHH